MKTATQELPSSYRLYRKIDESKYAKAIWLVILLGVLVFWAAFFLFNHLAGSLRPDYQIVERANFQLSIDRLINIIRVLLPVILMLLLHESIHALLLWFYTKEFPRIVITFEGIGGIAVRMPSWYLSRNTFLVANMAPVCLFTLGFPFLVLIAPLRMINTLVFCTAINLAGSLSDMVSSIYVFFHPADTYVNTDGAIYHHQDSSSISRWKLRFRSFIERILTILESSA